MQQLAQLNNLECGELWLLHEVECASRRHYATEDGMLLEDAAGWRRMESSDVGLLKWLVSHLTFTMLSVTRLKCGLPLYLNINS